MMASPPPSPTLIPFPKIPKSVNSFDLNNLGMVWVAFASPANEALAKNYFECPAYKVGEDRSEDEAKFLADMEAKIALLKLLAEQTATGEILMEAKRLGIKSYEKSFFSGGKMNYVRMNIETMDHLCTALTQELDEIVAKEESEESTKELLQFFDNYYQLAFDSFNGAKGKLWKENFVNKTTPQVFNGYAPNNVDSAVDKNPLAGPMSQSYDTAREKLVKCITLVKMNVKTPTSMREEKKGATTDNKAPTATAPPKDKWVLTIDHSTIPGRKYYISCFPNNQRSVRIYDRLNNAQNVAVADINSTLHHLGKACQYLPHYLKDTKEKIDEIVREIEGMSIADSFMYCSLLLYLLTINPLQSYRVSADAVNETIGRSQPKKACLSPLRFVGQLPNQHVGSQQGGAPQLAPVHPTAHHEGMLLGSLLLFTRFILY